MDFFIKKKFIILLSSCLWVPLEKAYSSPIFVAAVVAANRQAQTRKQVEADERSRVRRMREVDALYRKRMREKEEARREEEKKKRIDAMSPEEKKEYYFNIKKNKYKKDIYDFFWQARREFDYHIDQKLDVMHTGIRQTQNEIKYFIHLNSKNIDTLEKKKKDLSEDKNIDNLILKFKESLDELNSYYQEYLPFENWEIDEFMRDFFEEHKSHVEKKFAETSKKYNNLGLIKSDFSSWKKQAIQDAIEIENLRKQNKINVKQGFYRLKYYEEKRCLFGKKYQLKKQYKKS